MTEKSDPVEVMARAIARAEHDALQVGGVGEDLEVFDPEAAFDCYMDHARAALAAAEAAGMVMVRRDDLERICTWFGVPKSLAETDHVRKLAAAMIEAASLAQQEKP